MKALYEATNGYVGESYTRAYVWADSEEEARSLAVAAFSADAQRLRYPARYHAKVVLRLLFTADAPPFATTPSDSGWE